MDKLTEQHASHQLRTMADCSGTQLMELLMPEVSLVNTPMVFMHVQISQRMWSLFPQLHQCYMEWGFNYLENLLVPLDNYISRGTDTFLSSKDPNYHAMV